MTSGMNYTRKYIVGKELAKVWQVFFQNLVYRRKTLRLVFSLLKKIPENCACTLNIVPPLSNSTSLFRFSSTIRLTLFFSFNFARKAGKPVGWGFAFTGLFDEYRNTNFIISKIKLASKLINSLIFSHYRNKAYSVIRKGWK